MKFLKKLLGGKESSPAESKRPEPFLPDDPKELAQTSLICNPEFTEAIRVLAENPSQENKRLALDELLKITVWIATEESSGSARGDGKENVQLECVRLQDGTGAVTGFTDPFAAKLFMGGSNFSMLNIGLKALIEAMEGKPVSDIVINHAGPAGIRLIAEELPYLARGENPYSH